MHEYLTDEESVTASLHTTSAKGKIKFVLSPLNPVRGRPKKNEDLNKLLNLLSTSEDWSQLKDFLRELKIAKYVVDAPMIGKLIRKAVVDNQIGLILELFRRTETTGFKLKEFEFAREIMNGLITRAMTESWSKGSLERGLKNANTALKLMRDPRHCPAYNVTLAGRPEVLGAALALACNLCIRHSEGIDSDNLVTTYAQQLLTNWQTPTLSPLAESKPALASLFLLNWSVTYQGIHLALKVLSAKDSGLGGAVSKDASRTEERLSRILEQDLKPELQKAIEILEKEEKIEGELDGRAGLILYRNMEASLMDV